MSRKLSTRTSTGTQKTADSSQQPPALPAEPATLDILRLKACDARAHCRQRNISLDNQPLEGAALAELHEALLLHFGLVSKSDAAPVGCDPLPTNFGDVVEEKVQAALQAVLTRFAERLAPLERRVEQVQDDQSALKAEVIALKAEKRDLHGSLSFLEEQITRLQGQVSAAIAGCAAAAADAPSIERKSTNLSLINLPDCNSQSDAEALVTELLATIDAGVKTTSVQYRPYRPSYASAASARTGDRPRTGSVVVVQCASVQDKKTVYRNVKKLRDSKFHHTHVDDDLTPSQYESRKAQQATYQALRQAGKRPHWRGATIWVDKKPYQPPALSEERRTASRPASLPSGETVPLSTAAPELATTNTYSNLDPQAPA